MHCILEVSRYTNIVYTGVYLVLTLTKIIFNCLLLFNLFLLATKLKSQVSKFHNFFLTCSETEARCIFEGPWYCHLWKVQFQCSGTFLAFFQLVCKFLKSLFQ